MNTSGKYPEIAQLTENGAREYLEHLRWPTGPACPHCGGLNPYRIVGKADSKRPARKGLYKCRERGCRQQFTVTTKTVFESSHISLTKWLQAIALLCASKKGISAHQLHRMLGITYKSAWFMAHRIRYAMQQPPLAKKLDGIVECDEVYIGGKARGKRGRGALNKTPVVSLVQRGGPVRSMAMQRVTAKNLRSFIKEHVDEEAVVMTDNYHAYRGLRHDFKYHGVVRHNLKEYVRGNDHTNTIEGYFSILKRGIVGVYQHVSARHLHRYLSEFDYRYNRRYIDDSERTLDVVPGIEGKRLTYRDSLRRGA